MRLEATEDLDSTHTPTLDLVNSCKDLSDRQHESENQSLVRGEKGGRGQRERDTHTYTSRNKRCRSPQKEGRASLEIPGRLLGLHD